MRRQGGRQLFEERIGEMNSSDLLAGQGRRMLQIGAAHFVFSGLEGFAIPHLPSPPLGRSVHTLSGLQGVMMLALGLLWPGLKLNAAASRIAFWTYTYSSVATLVSFVLAAVWGAGNTTMPLAAGTARGSARQEATIRIVQYSAAPPFFVSMALILWGLRMVEGRLRGR
jgi:hydroxylaminobenzene mutase